MDEDEREALALLRLASPSPAWYELSMVVNNEQELLDAFEVRDLVDVSIVLDRSGRYEREVFLQPDGVGSEEEVLIIMVARYGVGLPYPFSIDELDKEIKEHIQVVADEYEADA